MISNIKIVLRMPNPMQVNKHFSIRLKQDLPIEVA